MLYFKGTLGGRHTQKTYIFKGLPLIAIESCKKYNIANAEEFKVMSFTKKNVTIGIVLEDGSVDEEYMEVPLIDFPKMLQPSYCISVHRSQCATFRTPYTIYQTKKMRLMDAEGGDMGARLLYVALSRASDIGLINVSDVY